MKDLSKEIMAYSLQNALEHGKAETSKILPKLFQHGLEKQDIGKIIPAIEEAVRKVNSMEEKDILNQFKVFESHLKKRNEEKKDLSDLNVKDKPVFRLAPFPSGALHIGNAKTYLLNALYAEKYKGKILLVMDDTIGSEEKQPLKESYKLIEEAFNWLGVKYKKPVIYKSDRLKIYYSYAKKLIEKDKAYVCYCSAEELRENRAKGVECSCRQFPKKIHLLRWKEMFNMEEGHAVLRIKTSMMHPNPAFRDRVLFKISDRLHPRVGKKYRVWPTLEMSWAVDDYLLGITHILRGNDLYIETEMENYIWDIFKWKKPTTIHTGLVRIEGVGAKVSKSKAQKEVKNKTFIGWDDPRTWSIQSLARRGIQKEAIRKFVKEIGLNKQDITVPIETLYSINRSLVDANAERYSFVEEPVKIKIKNNPGIKEIEMQIHPDRKDTRKIKIKKEVIISKKDFDEFKNKEIRLNHLFNITLENEAEVLSIDNKKIPRINWISQGLKARIFMPYGEWIEGIADDGIKRIKKGDLIQFERFGFVRFDGKKKGNYEFWFAHK